MAPNSKKTTAKPAAPIKSATPLPLKASQNPSSRKADRAGFSTDDALVSAPGATPVELRPAESHTHVPTRAASLWGEE